MLIELDIFSGRPNPSWTLDEGSSRRLAQLQEALAATAREIAELPALGYRGFVYEFESGRVRAFRGTVQTARSVLADPTLSIERFLLETLPSEFSEHRSRLEREILGST